MGGSILMSLGSARVYLNCLSSISNLVDMYLKIITTLKLIALDMHRSVCNFIVMGKAC